ncbi:hypothetical protein [Chlorogloeopsis sp. ULAP02]|uniref:hypothetical protein n=1 Tax=Chlorogloeopsis sp. ULAP02 TaxID=3107926 RepID=UPI003135379A
MNQQNGNHNRDLIKLDLLRLLGAIVGGTIAYIITSNLPAFSSVLVCAMGIALSSLASTRSSHPTLWWASLGTIAGSIMGTGSALADSIAQFDLSDKVLLRRTIIGFLSIAGLISGIILGRNLHKTHIPPPRDFLKVVSGLTAGVFALIVTIKFTWDGLEQARVLSSRLSTITTILATSLAVPAWLGYQLGRFR